MANLKEKLGSKIQKIRKLRGLTQEQLAEMLDMDTPNLSNIERGKRFMTAETLEKIAKALKVSEKDLFSFEKKISNEEVKKIIISELENLKDKELLYLQKVVNDIKALR